MNNKYLKYFLIIAVVAVWATIVYRIIHGLSDPAIPAIERKQTVKEEYNLKEDSFKLYADYPDPFLPDSDADLKDSLIQKNDPAGSHMPSSPPATDNTAPIETIVVYNGIISNPKKRSRVAIVTIHGKEYMVREQETVDGIKILKITTSKLLISYKGEVVTIGK